MTKEVKDSQGAHASAHSRAERLDAEEPCPRHLTKPCRHPANSTCSQAPTSDGRRCHIILRLGFKTGHAQAQTAATRLLAELVPI